MESSSPTYDFYTLPTAKPTPAPTHLSSKYATQTYRPRNTLVLRPKASQPINENSRQFDSESEKEPSDNEKEPDLELKEEMKTDVVLSKVLSTNFAEVDLKPKAKKLTKKGKYQENYVKLNLNKFKKKTFANKKPHKLRKVADIKFESEDLPCFTLSNQRKERISVEAAAELFELTSDQVGVVAALHEGGRVYYESNPPCAALYKAFARVTPGLTVVIVPYLTLMYDRLVHLPSELSGALLTASMNFKSQSKVYAMLKEGMLDIVFVTPEKFMQERWENYAQVSLVVVEEVQSVSEWSQSQRAAYIQLPAKLRSGAMLGLTTSVAPNVRLDVYAAFDIIEANKHVKPPEANMRVTISRDPDVTTAVHKLMRKPEFSSGQVIVYVASQYQAFSVTDWLRAKGEKASAYTSKMTSSMRDRVQKQFLEKTIRIIVATSGFLVYDASVTSVIHACLPRSFESFLQLTVHSCPVSCHLLLSLASVYYQRAQLFANYMSKNDLIKLFKLFSTPHVQLAIEDTSDSLGIEKSALKMLLNHLEKDGLLEVMPPAFLTGLVTLNKMTPEQAAKEYAVLSHVIAKGKYVGGSWRFNLGKVAAEFSCTSAELVSSLKKLEYMRKLRLELRDETYEVRVKELPTNEALLEKTAALQELSNRTLITAKTKLETCFDVLTTYATDTISQLEDCTAILANDIEQYLKGELSTSHAPQRLPENLALEVKGLIRDFSGMPQPKELVHILQGIHTEHTPMSRWKGSGCWGRYLKYDFFALLDYVTEVLAGELDTKIDFARRRKSLH